MSTLLPLDMGSVFIGMCCGLVMYGFSVHQTWRYFQLYRQDMRLLKSIVAVLFVADTFHSCLSVIVCYHYLVQNLSNPAALDYGTWSIRSISATSALSMVVSAGFAIVDCVESFILPTISQFVEWTWSGSVAFACVVVTDLAVTSSIILYLRKRRTGIKHTDNVLGVIEVYTINSGLLTATLSLLSVIFVFVCPRMMLYISLNMPTTKSYVNSVFAVLNSRKALKASLMDDFGMLGMSTATDKRGGNLVRMRHMTMPQSIVAFNPVFSAESKDSDIRLGVRSLVDKPETAVVRDNGDRSSSPPMFEDV
ncbi:uncharacterized protein BXZ73DRAFT_100980 [Epithele typhae]|uniref:uncharacterized protein n=1 Tax=Epithele typhae TaxID=378194 RepID=UPI002008D29D|nr:uncharacterized protein BXZ73DRAFT_100980 [Epithele typhae]KAH9933598.1 hypothetical protein BXZ73DRAFT_100980 [Epithele typhae]